MIVVSVFYPKHSGLRFDHEYYLQKHTPLLKLRWNGLGLVNVELLRGASALDGGQSAFEMIALLTFNSIEDMQAALAASGNEIVGDIANFTNVQPLIQINQPVTN
jgi:uncharacterized protein (TIGR02118 family)